MHLYVLTSSEIFVPIVRTGTHPLELQVASIVLFEARIFHKALLTTTVSRSGLVMYPHVLVGHILYRCDSNCDRWIYPSSLLFQ